MTVYLFLTLYLYSFEVQADPIIYLEWVEDPTTTMIVNWVAGSGSNTLMEYRERDSGASWSSVNANELQLPNTSQRRFQAKINGLSPGSSYEFRINSIPGTRYFRTAPAGNENPVRFLVGGDLFETRVTGARFEELKQIFEQVTDLAATYNPLFLVVGGDYVHTPDDYPDVEHWIYLLSTLTEKLVTSDGNYQIPMIGSLGNHDVPEPFENDPEEAIYFHGFFSYPQEQWGSTRSYGVLDFADYLSIITLDSNHTHSISSQSSWLNNTLADRQNVGHVYPVYHISGWPVFRSFRGELVEQIRDEWHPIFRDNNTRLVFEHHEHVYKRTYPFECEPPILNRLDCNQTPNGVISLGGGSWGSGVRETHPNYQSGGGYTNILEVIEEENNFVLMEITQTRRKAQAMSITRGVIDEFDEVFFLPEPQVLEGTNVSASSFVANWEAVVDAEQYRLDVSESSNFSTFVSGYQNLNVGDTTSFEVTGLNPGLKYYYRVRARTAQVQSSSSSSAEIQTVSVDPDLSSVESSGELVQANEEDTGIVTVLVKDENGNELENVNIRLFNVSCEARAIENNLLTDENGTVNFEVTNNKSGTVTLGARAGETELTDKVDIQFIPAAPIVLSASDVDEREFTANWEMQQEADSYQIDVSTDNEFSNFLEGFNSRELANVTSERVTGAEPGTDYFYRVRAVSNGLEGANSEEVDLTTFPEVPVAMSASKQNALQFTANWQPAEGARGYLIDVAIDENFEKILDQYDGYEVPAVESLAITSLSLNSTYYYRVRSIANHRVSGVSNSIETSTLNISSEQSEISASQLRVFADGNQKNHINVHLKSVDGTDLKGLEVILSADSETTVIENETPVTDDSGQTTFEVSNEVAEIVKYSVFVNSQKVGEISLEFLRDEGELKLGDNFPNPFSNQTNIPFTIPTRMNVEITIFNALGTPVRTLLNEERERGYYEIPFQIGELASGVYFYRLAANNTIKTKKMILIN